MELVLEDQITVQEGKCFEKYPLYMYAESEETTMVDNIEKTDLDANFLKDWETVFPTSEAGDRDKAGDDSFNFESTINRKILADVRWEIQQEVASIIEKFIENMEVDFLNVKIQLCREFALKELEYERRRMDFLDFLEYIAKEDSKTAMNELGEELKMEVHKDMRENKSKNIPKDMLKEEQKIEKIKSKKTKNKRKRRNSREDVIKIS